MTGISLYHAPEIHPSPPLFDHALLTVGESGWITKSIAEVAVNLSLLNVRAEENSCIAQRLGEIDALLTRPGEKAPAAKGIWVGRPSDLPMFVERWRSVTSSGRSALFSPDEQKVLDNLFAVFGEFRSAELREQAGWTKLKLLERWDGPLDPETRRELIEAVEEARHEDFEIRRSIYYGVGLAKALTIIPDPDYGAVEDAPRSVCIPTDTPLEKALAMQKDRVPSPD